MIQWTDQVEGYVLHEPLVYVTDAGIRITVNPGFWTDLASVPRWALPVVSKGDRSAKAAVVHDALYIWRPCDRETADAIMYEAALAAHEAQWRAYVMWAAVRWGGDKYWQNPPDKQINEVDLFEWKPGPMLAPALLSWGTQ